MCGDPTGRCRNSMARPGAHAQAQKREWRKWRAQAVMSGALGGPPPPDYADWQQGPFDGWGGDGGTGSEEPRASSQPPAVAPAAATPEGPHSQATRADTTSGVPAVGPHGWRVAEDVDAELAAATEEPGQGEEVDRGGAASGNPAGEPVQGEVLHGIESLTALLKGPVLQAMREVRWEDQLEDPQARDVVRDLIKFVWSEHGSGVSSTTATGSQ